jgi:hypothetical protein
MVTRPWSPAVVTTAISNDCGSYWVRLPQYISEATLQIDINPYPANVENKASF